MADEEDALPSSIEPSTGNPEVESAPGLPEEQQADTENKELRYEWKSRLSIPELPLGVDNVLAMQLGHMILYEQRHDSIALSHQYLLTFNMRTGKVNRLDRRWETVDEVIDDGAFRMVVPWEVGYSLITAHVNGVLRVWNLVSGQLACRLAGIYSPITCLKVMDSTAMAGSHSGVIAVWDLRRIGHTYHPVRTMRGHLGPILCIESENDILVSGGEDKAVRVWSLQTGACMHILNGHSLPVQFVCMDMYDIVTVGANAVTGLGFDMIQWHVRPGHPYLWYILMSLPCSKCCTTNMNVSLASGTDTESPRMTHLKLVGDCLVSAGEDGVVTVWLRLGGYYAPIRDHYASTAVVSLDMKESVVVFGMKDGTVVLIDNRVGFCAQIMKDADKIWQVEVVSANHVVVAYEKAILTWVANFELTIRPSGEGTWGVRAPVEGGMEPT
ncbi:hypothetical protein N7535_005212 [Penicillium sp. DV-2018c]|nr:hypothetical protein N7535_005212 [Penicillium sp. DV-2018c]